MIGGYETMADLIATGLTSNGHVVRVITYAKCPQSNIGDVTDKSPFEVIRCPSFWNWNESLRWADVYLCFNLSIKALLPWALCPRPLVISHQGWYSDVAKPVTLNASLKLRLTHLASNIACSHAVANYLPSDSVVIPNSFDSETFRIRPDIPQTNDVLFVGRLVSDKGCSLLIRALKSLADTGINLSTTIVGDGPARTDLQNLVVSAGLGAHVSFVGPKRGEQLAHLMNSHRVLAVPSIWPEPFGIVALEGIASGCVVIGSQEGGLKDAIGPCGIAIPNGEWQPLADGLRRVLCERTWLTPEAQKQTAHLEQHHPRNVTLAFEQVLMSALSYK